MAIIDKIQLSGTVYTIGNETTTAVTSASTDNEIPTAKAVYDAIPKGGGGKTINSGRGISITTGETADTVSFNLPISAGTRTNALIYNSTTNSASGNYSNAEGEYTTASGYYSHAEGYIANANGYASHAEGESTKSKGYSSHAEGTETEANGDYSHSEGHYTRTTNESEHSSGRYNNSVSASTTFGDSGNTLFSVGNGKSNSSRHNAIDIRQNGDIYIADTNDISTTNYYQKPMIKLQDALRGGGGSITIDQSLDSGSTNPVANSAITNAINDKISNIYRDTTDFVGSGVTSLNVSYKVGSSEIKTYCASINNKEILTGSDYTKVNKFSLVETSAITTSVTSSSTDSQVPSAKAVYDQLGGLKRVKLSQSEYDSLTTKNNSILYVIVN